MTEFPEDAILTLFTPDDTGELRLTHAQASNLLDHDVIQKISKVRSRSTGRDWLHCLRRTRGQLREVNRTIRLPRMMSTCDGCGKERRIYRTQEVVIGGEVDDRFQFCFLCVKEDERKAAKAEREEMNV